MTSIWPLSVAETVKVPQMAESISEGTLKTWLKQPGDTVQADEEVATIETDKVCCPVFTYIAHGGFAAQRDLHLHYLAASYDAICNLPLLFMQFGLL